MSDKDQSVPLNAQDSTQSVPLALVVQYGRFPRRLRRYKAVEDLAVNKYGKNGKGITYTDLLINRLASSKEQAQSILKRCLAGGFLFTLGDTRPQQYYPMCLKSDITSRSVLIEHPGVGYFSQDLSASDTPTHHHHHHHHQDLEGYILPLLPQAPFFIHNMQFKVQVPQGCYYDVGLPACLRNKRKQFEEVIGWTRALYCMYENGTVMVYTENSRNPFRLHDVCDLIRLMAFLGQVRDRLVLYLSDQHERLVPDIRQWQLTQWDLNKDIPVDDRLAVTGLRMQVGHLDGLYRIYFKNMGKNTVCRVERSCSGSSAKSAIETIHEIFNFTNANGHKAGPSSGVTE